MTTLTTENVNCKNIKDAIKKWNKEDWVKLAVFSAELFIDLYDGNSDIPKKAIQAAKDWLENPTEENKNICKESALAACDIAGGVVIYSAAAAAASDEDSNIYASCAAIYTSDADVAAAYSSVGADVEAKQKIADYINNKNDELFAKALEESKEPEQVEWNGEGLPPVGCKIRTKDGISEVLSTSNFEGGVVTYWYTHKEGGANIGCAWNNKSWITQIETPEQKKERELLEAAHELYNKSTNTSVSFDEFKRKKSNKTVEVWIKAVEITGYRKSEYRNGE